MMNLKKMTMSMMSTMKMMSGKEKWRSMSLIILVYRVYRMSYTKLQLGNIDK